MDIINQMKIKDLLILRCPGVFQCFEETIEKSNQKNLNILDLTLNPYIYETRSSDIGYLIKYLNSLDGLADVFRELYDNFIYELRVANLLDESIYNNDQFHYIFNAINDELNYFVNNQYAFEDFGIYMGQTSLETCIALYDKFVDYFVRCLSGKIDANFLKSFCMQRNIRNIYDIYESIFEKFEEIYLPFY